MQKKSNNISPKTLSKIVGMVFSIIFLFLFFLFFEIYIPVNPFSSEKVTYSLEKGESVNTLSSDLKQLGLVRDSNFFKFYLAGSLKYSSLKAGKYVFSSKMSAYEISKKMFQGDTVKTKVTILEGWNLATINQYLYTLNLCQKDEFLEIASEDWSREFDFLKDKPKDITLEGYIFPDTYEFEDGKKCSDFLASALNNFGKKLTPELRSEIQKQKKSVFDIVIMASMVEKEVKTLEDKKLVSGILWKRLDANMPLQIDATVNYVTGKKDPGVSVVDTQIDSAYNTYKYRGLPKGPISNPGVDSLIAALYPTPNPYWYYLSDGVTHYSKTFEEHKAARVKYLNQ
jgi:UPF0755 protein